MGAMAISVLVGATLVENTKGAPFLQSLLPFIKGFTVFFWATGTCNNSSTGMADTRSSFCFAVRKNGDRKKPIRRQ